MDRAIPTSFRFEKGRICIDEDIKNNTFTVDGIDYYAYYLNPRYKNNKGANKKTGIYKNK